jgi:hypothetical protein
MPDDGEIPEDGMFALDDVVDCDEDHQGDQDKEDPH